MAAFDPKTAALTLNNDVPEVTRPFQIQDLENLYNLLYTCLASGAGLLNPGGYSEPAIIAGGDFDLLSDGSTVKFGPSVFSYLGKLYMNTEPLEVSAGSTYGLCLVERNTDNRVFGDGVTRPFASVGLVVAVPENGSEPDGFVKRLGYPSEMTIQNWKADAWYGKIIPGQTIANLYGTRIVDKSITEAQLQEHTQTGLSWNPYLIPGVLSANAITYYWDDVVELLDFVEGPALEQIGLMSWEVKPLRLSYPESGSTTHINAFSVASGAFRLGPNRLTFLVSTNMAGSNMAHYLKVKSHIPWPGDTSYTEQTLTIEIPNTSEYLKEILIPIDLVRMDLPSGDITYIPVSYSILK